MCDYEGTVDPVGENGSFAIQGFAPRGEIDSLGEGASWTDAKLDDTEVGLVRITRPERTDSHTFFEHAWVKPSLWQRIRRHLRH